MTYNFLPFFHIAGKFILLGTMLADCRMLLRPRFSAGQFWPDVRAHGATVTVGVGGICHMLYAEPRKPDDADNPLRMIYSVPNPHEVQVQFLERFDLQLTEGYGSTEANIVVYTRPDEPTPKGAAGRAAPYYEVAIFDEMDRPVPPAPRAKSWSGRHPYILMEGLRRLAGGDAGAFRNLWFHSGDRGHMDENGFLFFHDRMKDVIRRRGENSRPSRSSGSSTSTRTLPRPPPSPSPPDVGEDEVKIVVVRNPGAALTEGGAAPPLRGRDALLHGPALHRVQGDLPRTPTQKVRKVVLREEGITAATWDREAAGFKVTRDGLKRRL